MRDFRGLVNTFMMPQSSILLPGEGDQRRVRVILTINMDNGVLPEAITLQGGTFRNMKYEVISPPPFAVGRVWYRPAVLPEAAEQREWLLSGGLLHERFSLYDRVARAPQFDLPEAKKNDGPEQSRRRGYSAWREWVATYWGVEMDSYDEALGKQAP